MHQAIDGPETCAHCKICPKHLRLLTLQLKQKLLSRKASFKDIAIRNASSVSDYDAPLNVERYRISVQKNGSYPEQYSNSADLDIA